MKNKIHEPLLILLFSTAILVGISLIPKGIYNLEFPDYLSDLKVSAKKQSVHPEQKKYTGQTDSSFIAPAKMLADTTVNSFGDLTKFFEALYALQTNPNAIHIAYFGDSMIEGDLITMDLRSMMQKRFGGKGIGFMPLTSATASYRSTIKHQFNELWETYNYVDKPPVSKKLAWSGFNFIGNPGAYAEYNKSKGYAAFNHVKAFVNNRISSELEIIVGDKTINKILDVSDSIQTIEFQDITDFSKLSIKVKSGAPEFYGLNFENGPGIYVDNYSFRGNSGIPLASIDQDMYQFASNHLNCKLVILHYGLNVVGHESGDYSWYLSPFRKTIKKIKASFPNATIVLASVGDKAYKYGNQYQTEPDIPLFVGMQVKLAREENIVFWNMYKAMGGYNSMKRWVEDSPKKAAKDYTHLNHAGAKEIATLFYEWLMEEYNTFLQKKLEDVSEANPKNKEILIQ
jgi:hypothetical protein